VERINLKVGKLAAVVPDSLKFCFEVAAKNTPLEGAILHIEEIPVTARCKHVGTFGLQFNRFLFVKNVTAARLICCPDVNLILYPLRWKRRPEIVNP
jgi:Zn finger protein HypA/HybF involved in hydrogenase expression